MGFCKMCGNIVTGPRCKCGGTAVKPSVDFSEFAQPDMWSRTYARSTENSPSSSHARERCTTLPASASRPDIDTRRLRRPQSTVFSRSPIGDQVSSHIDAVLRREELLPDRTGSQRDTNNGIEFPSSPDDIFSDPQTLTLSKVYGSVLQPKDTLTTFTCFICSDPFPPDATLYPDPSEPSTGTRFLCKHCFTSNGGAKGNCQSCSRPILILASEGGFIENGGRFWHKGCFRCDGCFKNISDTPMVDLLGKPSCEECFDSCLKRPRADSTSSKRFPVTPDKFESRSNLGGMKGTSRDASPALDELQHRLGIIKSRETTPLTERMSSSSEREQSPLMTDLNQRLGKMTAASTPSQRPIASDGSPTGRYARFRRHSQHFPVKNTPIVSPTPRSETNAVREMERRLSRLSGLDSSSSQSSLSAQSFTPSLTESESTSTFSHPSTPPSSPPALRHLRSDKTPTKSVSPLPNHEVPNKQLSSPSTPCAKCAKPLFRTRGGGKFVTVPEESSKGLPPRSFHVECFRCAVCDYPFEETKNGQAIFVRSSSGCCHVGCATPERIVIRPVRHKSSLSSPISNNLSPTKPSRAPPPTAPATMTSFPRFGIPTTCPGCRISVSHMERGVVPGPQGSRWHSSCLICGGKGLKEAARRDPNIPGCGKRLDSAAKTDGDGGVWCRECLLLVSNGILTGQDSPIRALEPTFTGGADVFGRFRSTSTSRSEGVVPQLTGTTTLARQLTGTTTIARQFTGLNALTNQLTGGGLSPTRQLPKDLNRAPSPTKMLGNQNSGRRVLFPRPKSMVGILPRGKSVDEGRGMFLVRQMTGQAPIDSDL